MAALADTAAHGNSQRAGVRLPTSRLFGPSSCDIAPLDGAGKVSFRTKPVRPSMIRLSGSVKLRCAVGSGMPDGRMGLGPRRLDGVPSALTANSRRAASFAAAAAFASASRAARAARMRSSRCCLLAIQSGVSSPRWSGPCLASSVASTSAALSSQLATSAASRLRPLPCARSSSPCAWTRWRAAWFHPPRRGRGRPSQPSGTMPALERTGRSTPPGVGGGIR